MSRCIVETSGGKLRGESIDGVRVFKGIPYGDSTAGARRFRAPRPAPAWSGVRDALTSGPAAPQCATPQNTDPFYAWYSAIGPIGEDCLVLNVFTPGPETGKRPVMVWIHGGGWREFSGSAPGFDGCNLARAEDVVVVALNHRLSAFGFFPPDPVDDRFADAGNAGLLDIALALGWVRDNIAAFGGDPGNVTIFGESGGASKIAAILSMPAMKGLFHKAILQSSAGGMGLARPEDMAMAQRELAAALGRDHVDCASLQKLSMEALLAALAKVTTPFRGMIDGRHFTDDPFGECAPPLAAGVPVLAGCTDTETTYHLRMAPGNFALDLPTVRRRLGRFMQCDEAAVDRLLAAHAAEAPDASPSDRLAAVTSDFVFKRNTYRMAELQAAQAPVYAYLFSRRSDVEDGVLGAPHTCEVPFIFGTESTAEACIGPADAPDVAPMRRRMMASWAAFARAGDPNNPHIPNWPRFRPDERMMMVFDHETRAARDPGGALRASFGDIPYFGYAHAFSAILHD